MSLIFRSPRSLRSPNEPKFRTELEGVIKRRRRRGGYRNYYSSTRAFYLSGQQQERLIKIIKLSPAQELYRWEKRQPKRVILIYTSNL